MSVKTITHDNLVKHITNDVGITVTGAKLYPIGSLVTSLDGVTYSDADVLLSTDAGYNTQTVYVLSEEVDATLADVASIGYEGEFNANNVTLPGTQTLADIAGVLQAKNINLKVWSK